MWKKVKKPILCWFSTPLPTLSRKEPFMTEMWWQTPFFPSYYFRRASETPKPSSDIYLYPPESGIVLVVHIQRTAPPCPVWSRRCKKRGSHKEHKVNVRNLVTSVSGLTLLCKAALFHFLHCFFFFFLRKLQFLCNFSLGRIFAKEKEVLDNSHVRLKRSTSIYSFSTFTFYFLYDQLVTAIKFYFSHYYDHVF